jgi:hypothetical protein
MDRQCALRMAQGTVPFVKLLRNCFFIIIAIRSFLSHFFYETLVSAPGPGRREA